MNIQECTLLFRLDKGNNFINLEPTNDIKNFIADLQGLDIEVVKKIKDKLLIFAKSIKKNKNSFVIVYNFSFDDELVIVPTIQEAYDYIEMEEFERQLEL